MAKQLLKKIEITGTLTLLTGLHIGGTNSSMSIGGIDKGVIRNPLTNQPFIPGSSLKGKMRSLLEVSNGKFTDAGVDKKPRYIASTTGDAADLFGNAVTDNQKPSRLIVRDCELSKEIEANGMPHDAWLLSKTDIPYTEGKTEVVIDRITSAANPRQIERVPAGAKFKLNMVLNVWEGEAEATLIANLFKSLKLLKDDYLGGSGSRGYGQIGIDIDDMIEKTTENYYGKADGKGVSIKSTYQNQINSLKA
jgi:CRISPR-associated protein Csm3